MAHFNNVFERQAVKLGKFRKQVNGIEGRTKYGHHERPCHTSDNGISLRLMEKIYDGRRKQETAAYHKVGQIAHKSSGSAFKQQLQDDLTELDHYTGYRAERKCPD